MRRLRLFEFVDRNFVKPVEEAQFPWWYWFLIFCAFVIVRNTLEGAFESLHIIGFSPSPLKALEELFLHTLSFFTALYISSAVVIHLISRVPIARVTKVLFAYSFIICIPPLVDLLFSTRGFRLLYAPESWMVPGAVNYHLNPFAPASYGMSPGMKVELMLGTVLSIFYVLLRTRSVWRGLLTLVGIEAVLVFGSFLVPFLVLVHSWFTPRGGLSFNEVCYGGGLIADPSRRWFLLGHLLIAFILIAWYALHNRRHLAALVKSIPPVALIVGTGLPVAGFLAGCALLAPLPPNLFANPFDHLAVVATAAAGFFLVGGSWLRLKLRSVPLPESEVRAAGAVMLVLGLGFAVSAGYPVLLGFILALVAFVGAESELVRRTLLAGLGAGLAAAASFAAGAACLLQGRTGELLPRVLPAAVLLAVLLAILGWRGHASLARRVLLTLAAGLVVTAGWPLAQRLELTSERRLRLAGYAAFLSGENYTESAQFNPLLYGRARTAYREAQALGFEDPWLDFRTGFVLQQTDSLMAGLAELERFDDTDVLAYRQHARAMLAVGARVAGRLRAAADLFGTVIRENYEAALAYRQLGMVYAAQGDAAQARNSWLATWRLGEARSDVLVDLGLLDRQVENGERAGEYFRLAWHDNPRNRRALLLHGNFLWSEGRTHDALRVYRRGLMDFPRDVLLWNNVGVAHAAQREFDAAARAFTRAIQCNPAYEDAWVNLGRTLEQAGRAREAAEVYRQLLARSPDHPAALEGLHRLGTPP